MVQIKGSSLGTPPTLAYSNFTKNILVAAYSPLGNNIYNLPRAVDDPEVVALAKELGKSPAQLLIGWAVQRGTIVLPKSVTASRIKDNFEGENGTSLQYSVHTNSLLRFYPSSRCFRQDYCPRSESQIQLPSTLGS